MEIWYDSADATLLAPIAQQGWITGVTTNPRILSAQSIDAAKQIAQLLDIQTGFVAAQVTAMDEDGMIAQAHRLHALSDRIIVKVPVTTMGLKVIPKLTQSNIPTLATAVFSAEQFLLAATMGLTANQHQASRRQKRKELQPHRWLLSIGSLVALATSSSRHATNDRSLWFCH